VGAGVVGAEALCLQFLGISLPEEFENLDSGDPTQCVGSAPSPLCTTVVDR